jgi:hypothetical protein
MDTTREPSKPNQLQTVVHRHGCLRIGCISLAIIVILLVLAVGFVFNVPKLIRELPYFHESGQALEHDLDVSWGDIAYSNGGFGITITFTNRNAAYPFEVSYVGFSPQLNPTTFRLLDANPKQDSIQTMPDGQIVYYFKEIVIQPNTARTVQLHWKIQSPLQYNGDLTTTIDAYKPDVSPFGIFAKPSKQFKHSVKFK